MPSLEHLGLAMRGLGFPLSEAQLQSRGGEGDDGGLQFSFCVITQLSSCAAAQH